MSRSADYESETLQFIFETLGLPFRPCGLNADWSVSAYHVGPSSTPNRVSGDLYILDTEYEQGEYVLVRRVDADNSEDEIVQLSPRGESIVAAAKRAVAALRG